MTTRIPELTVSPRLWSLLGTTLYSHRPIIPITIRELLQNAHDAIISRYPGFTTPLTTDQIVFNLHVADTNYQHTRLECCDAGIGMTEDIILDKFLCLGASGKDVGVGGWGIAKAAIIGSCTDWSIHTHDLYLEQQDVITAQPIQTTEHLDGTQITLHYQIDPTTPTSQQQALTWTPRAVSIALSYLAHSHSACTVHYHQADLATQTWYFSPYSLPAEAAGSGGTEDWHWTAYQCSPLVEYPVLQCYLHNRPITYEIPSQNCLFWRVNGLVQCYDYTDSPYCWVIDITTTARPGEPAYPFNPSREQPVAALKPEVQEFIQPHELNPLTSSQLRAERDRRTKPEEVWYSGKLMSTNQPNTHPDHTSTSISTPTLNTPTLRFSAFTTAPPTSRQATQSSPLDVQMLIRGAHLSRSNPHAPKNVKFQAAWLEVLRVIHELGEIKEDWGIGFTHIKDVIAERYWHNGAAFYLINPRTARLHLNRPRETLLTMIFEACHEVTHQQHPNHNEYFTSRQDELYRTVIQQLPAFDHALEILSGKAAQLALPL